MAKRQRRQRRRITVGTIRRIDKKLSIGSPIRGRADPPAITAVPWWPLTVFIVGTKDLQLMMKTIVESVRKQIPTLKDTYFDFKVDSVRVWSTGSRLALEVYDLSRFPETSDPNTSIDHEIISVQYDVSGRNTFAHCGWKFGTIHSNAIHASQESLNDKFEVAKISTNGTSEFYVYIHLRIRLIAEALKASYENALFKLPNGEESENSFHMFNDMD